MEARVECRNPDYWGAYCISLYAREQEILSPVEAEELARDLMEAASHIRQRLEESKDKKRNALGIVIED